MTKGLVERLEEWLSSENNKFVMPCEAELFERSLTAIIELTEALKPFTKSETPRAYQYNYASEILSKYQPEDK